MDTSPIRRLRFSGLAVALAAAMASIGTVLGARRREDVFPASQGEPYRKFDPPRKRRLRKRKIGKNRSPGNPAGSKLARKASEGKL
jgi:hypothetical protein